MHTSRCVVSFTDSDNIQHEVQVWASTVYDAVAQAVNEFCRGNLASGAPAPHTELSVAVHQTPVTHRLKLQQVSRWAEGGGKSPQDVVERNRIRGLLAKHTQL